MAVTSGNLKEYVVDDVSQINPLWGSNCLIFVRSTAALYPNTFWQISPSGVPQQQATAPNVQETSIVNALIFG